MEEFVVSAIEQLWSFVAVALVIYSLGTVSKRIARARGWHRAGSWYDLTLRAHPLLAGMAFGLIPLPSLHVIDALQGFQLIVARCGWFTLAGAVCGQVYELVKYAFGWARGRMGTATIQASPATEPGGES